MRKSPKRKTWWKSSLAEIRPYTIRIDLPKRFRPCNEIMFYLGLKSSKSPVLWCSVNHPHHWPLWKLLHSACAIRDLAFWHQCWLDWVLDLGNYGDYVCRFVQCYTHFYSHLDKHLFRPRHTSPFTWTSSLTSNLHIPLHTSNSILYFFMYIFDLRLFCHLFLVCAFFLLWSALLHLNTCLS
jgi:hypothetical protein